MHSIEYQSPSTAQEDRRWNRLAKDFLVLGWFALAIGTVRDDASDSRHFALANNSTKTQCGALRWRRGLRSPFTPYIFSMQLQAWPISI
jgi:hypothetical protein